MQASGFKIGGSALKHKPSAFRGNSNDRKSSIGGDSNSLFPQGGIVGNHLHLDSSFRKGANLSKQTNNSVMIVDQDNSND